MKAEGGGWKIEDGGQGTNSSDHATPRFKGVENKTGPVCQRVTDRPGEFAMVPARVGRGIGTTMRQCRFQERIRRVRRFRRGSVQRNPARLIGDGGAAAGVPGRRENGPKMDRSKLQ